MYKKKQDTDNLLLKASWATDKKDGQMANIINIRRNIEIIAAYINYLVLRKKNNGKTNKLVNISIIKDET